MNELQKAAEILIETGIYLKSKCDERPYTHVLIPDDSFVGTHAVLVQPFADTLEGRRQADAIEDWLHKNHQSLLIKCKDNVQAPRLSEYNGRKKRLDRIKWCLHELIK